jgi:hypothetical protein
LTVIAIAGPNLPHAVLNAAGCHGGVIAFDTEALTPKAEQWIESKFAPWAFAVVEAWAEGAYDALDHVLFSRADDTSQRVYYYVCELQQRGLLAGPEPLIFDLAKIPRESSTLHTAEKVHQLAERLGVSEAALEEAIALANASAPVDNAGGAPVCLLAGTPPPDRRLHEVIAGGGFVAAGPTLAEAWLHTATPIEEGSGDPALAIARALQADPRGPRAFANPAKVLAGDIARSNAGAVVLWRIEEDDSQAWHLPHERRMLEEAGVPHLVLTRRDWLARDGAAREIASFLNEVNP